MKVGDTVQFHPANPSAEQDQPLAALVTYVHDDEVLNLRVFSPAGHEAPAQLIPRRDSEAHKLANDAKFRGQAKRKYGAFVNHDGHSWSPKEG